MPYMRDGYPAELANKVGHIKLIQDPMIQGMIEVFEDVRPINVSQFPVPTGSLDLSIPSSVRQVIVVDGGQQVVPNVARPERQVGFVQVAAILLKLDSIEYMRAHPVTDPRDLRDMLGVAHHTLAALPLSGVHLPRTSVRQSVRQVIHRYLSHYELDECLSYLVYRRWEEHMVTMPSMDCLACGETMPLPRFHNVFDCPRCGENHTLSDYLGLCVDQAEERPNSETVSNLRSVLEALVLFSFIVKHRLDREIMARTLFLLDGPLLLRAQLSRLVEPIRALIDDQRSRGLPLHLVGVEKSGEFASFAEAYSTKLENVGDYFVPSTEFILEDMYGRAYHRNTYRNRVNYGAKVVVRLGPSHVLPLDIPTGEYCLEPQVHDLFGFDDILRSLSVLLSYRYPNALIPIVLANSQASISNQPSGSILSQFVDRLLDLGGV